MSLADYVYNKLFIIADINKSMERDLDHIFNQWNARNILVDDFLEFFNFPKDVSLFVLLPFLTEHLYDEEYTKYFKQEELAKKNK